MPAEPSLADPVFNAPHSWARRFRSVTSLVSGRQFVSWQIRSPSVLRARKTMRKIRSDVIEGHKLNAWMPEHMLDNPL